MIITPKGVIGGEIRNISLLGAFIHSLDDLTGEKLTLIVKPPEAKRPFRINAAFAWTNIPESKDDLTSAGTAVRFQQLLDDSHSYIAKVVSSHFGPN
jgi:hypothetical protein